MSDMIERVARAIATEHRGTHNVDKAWDYYRNEAIAAIAAMREPTKEMIDAWIRAPGAIKMGWQAMVDAALEGK